MTLPQLQYFVNIYRAGSTVQAAELPDLMLESMTGIRAIPLGLPRTDFYVIYRDTRIVPPNVQAFLRALENFVLDWQ